MKRVQILILLVTVLAMLAVWPGGLVRRDTDVSSGVAHGYGGVPLSLDGTEIRQDFVAQSTHLIEHSFSLKLEGEVPDDYLVTYRLYGPDGEMTKLLAERVFSARELRDSGYCTVSLDLRVKRGKTYSYTVTASGPGCDAELYTTPYEEDFAAGSAGLYVNGEAVPGQAYGRFIYAMRLNGKNVLFYWAFLGTLGFATLEWSRVRKIGSAKLDK